MDPDVMPIVPGCHRLEKKNSLFRFYSSITIMPKKLSVDLNVLPLDKSHLYFVPVGLII